MARRTTVRYKRKPTSYQKFVARSVKSATSRGMSPTQAMKQAGYSWQKSKVTRRTTTVRRRKTVARARIQGHVLDLVAATNPKAAVVIAVARLAKDIADSVS